MAALSHFSPAHLALVAAPFPLAAALARWSRGDAGRMLAVRRALAAAVALHELSRYAWAWRRGWVDPPWGLPFDLCDVTLWLTVYSLVTLNRRTLELVWYFAMTGTLAALLFPDVDTPLASYETLGFFASHGMVLLAALFLALVGLSRPGRRSWQRAFVALCAWAALMGAVNWRWGTNYLFMREKPAAGSPMDHFGPWPWYLAVEALLAIVLFFLLSLPFRLTAGRRGTSR